MQSRQGCEVWNCELERTCVVAQNASARPPQYLVDRVVAGHAQPADGAVECMDVVGVVASAVQPIGPGIVTGPPSQPIFIEALEVKALRELTCGPMFGVLGKRREQPGHLRSDGIIEGD